MSVRISRCCRNTLLWKGVGSVISKSDVLWLLLSRRHKSQSSMIAQVWIQMRPCYLEVEYRTDWIIPFIIYVLPP